MSMKKIIIYIDMDGVLCDFHGAFTSALKAKPEQAYPQAEYGFFAKLALIKDAIASVNHLRQNPHYEVYILTAPSTFNPFSYAEKRAWIEQHFDMALVNNLIICGHKNLLQGDYLIDDCAMGHGQDKFCGELIHFGSPRCRNWDDVLKRFDI
jgi:5'(3')-deoxyribonucleotidase